MTIINQQMYLITHQLNKFGINEESRPVKEQTFRRKLLEYTTF
jgi:hypothetical protein